MRAVLVVACVAIASGLTPPPRRRAFRFGATPGDDGSGWLGAAPLLTKRNAARGAVVLVAAGGCASRSLRRTVRFQCGAGRIAGSYVRYGVETSLLRRPRDLDAVHEATGRRLEALVADMRGAYIKSAQLLSTAFPELLPAPWVRRLEGMTDDAPARPWATTRRVLEKELGVPVASVFRAFAEEPVGAASIGQVHRAVVRATNKTVAVKVQFPGARALMLSDLANVRRVVRLVKPALLPAVDEFRERVRGEFDYVEEARRMDACGAFLRRKRPRLGRRVVIPRSDPSLTTERVLTMDWLDGRSLRDSLSSEYDRARATGFFLQRWARLYLLRRKARAAVELVAEASGELIFGAACGFSADPHPGNVLVLDDGRLALIDYGCHVAFDINQRRTLADLYVALDRGDDAEAVDALADMGFVSENMNRTLMAAFATQCFDRDLSDDSPYVYLTKLERYDRVIVIPRQYMLVTRVSLLLRGLGSRVGCGRLSMARLWRRPARRARRALPPRARRSRSRP